MSKSFKGFLFYYLVDTTSFVTYPNSSLRILCYNTNGIITKAESV